MSRIWYRRLIRIGVLIGIGVILLIPYPFSVGGEFRLTPIHQLGIRAQVAGEIESVLVEEGQWVEKDQPLAFLVGREQKKKVEEIEAALDERNARLKLLKEGAKPEEIAKAKQEVNTAAKSLEFSILQADRYEEMFKDKAVSEKDYENILKQRDLDQERLELAKRNLELVESGARDEEIEALEAEIRLLEVNLTHAKKDLQLTTLVSTASGRIITPYLSQTVGHYLSVGDLFAVVEDANTLLAEIEVPEEDITEVKVGARVKLKMWAYPNKSFYGDVITIAPVAYEKSIGRIERTLTEREWRLEREETLREKGKVVRVVVNLSNNDRLLKTDMTGYAKIKCKPRPVVIAFTRWFVRFFLIEIWSWIP
jgi:multidrug resistance efflux pump